MTVRSGAVIDGPASPDSTSTPGPWEPLASAPSIGGLADVPPGVAVEVEMRERGGALYSRALVVPAAGSYRVEQYGAAGTSVSVLAEGTRYLFVPMDGVVAMPASEGGEPGPPLEWAYGASALENVPVCAGWERSGSLYRCRFITPDPEGAAGSAEVMLEVELDEQTGIPLREVVTVPAEEGGGSSEIRRRLLPVGTVDMPAPDDVRAAALAHWQGQIAALEDAPYDVFGLDLPGLVLKRVVVHPSKVQLDYGLPGLPPAAVSLRQTSSADPGAASLLTEWGTARYEDGSETQAFLRGDSIVLVSVIDGSVIGLADDPFAALQLTIEGVRDALVPLEQLSAAKLAPPPGYLGEGTP